MNVRERYQFGPFLLDPAERECRRGDQPVALTGKAFDLLQLLVRDPGRTIPKAELMQALWPETAVEEGNLTQNIFLIRKALGDETEHAAYIQTVPRIGYKFVMPVIAGEATPVAARPRPRQWIAAGGLIALLLLASGAILWRAKSATSPSIQSIAVLPLQNLSGDPAEEPFADGMTEALTSSLSRISALDVNSRTSMMQFKGSTNKSLPEIAREMHVDAIVEGSVQRFGGRVRIIVQLILASTDKHLWSKEYEGDATNVMKLQEEVARAIAQEIQAKITPEESHLLVSTRSVNVAAQDEYFMGQYDFTASMPSTLSSGAQPPTYNGFSPDRLQQANVHFLRATQIDPEYAEGYLGQAMVKMRNHDSKGALVLVEQGIKLDPTMAQLHLMRANIHYANWEWVDAEREYLKAAALNPSSLDGSEAYAQFFFATGRFERGAAFAERSLKKHPYSDGMEFQYGSNLFGAGRFEDAILHLKRAASMNPKSAYPPMLLFSVYKAAGRFREALALAEDLDRPHLDPDALVLRGRAYALLGRRSEALEILRKVSELGLGPRALILLHLDLGDKDRVFDLLNQGVDEGGVVAGLTKFAPSYAELHSDPRFQKLAARLNMPDLP